MNIYSYKNQEKSATQTVNEPVIDNQRKQIHNLLIEIESQENQIKLQNLKLYSFLRREEEYIANSVKTF